MFAYSLVPEGKLDKDPRNLSYLFPSMPLFKYKKATDEYFRLKAIQAIEHAARINGQLLVPASCFHWERKKILESNNIRIFEKSFYLIRKEDLSATELRKYLAKVQHHE